MRRPAADLLGHRVGVDPLGLGTPDDHVDSHVFATEAGRVEQVERAVAEGIGDGPTSRFGVVAAPHVHTHSHLGHQARRRSIRHRGSVDLVQAVVKR